MFRQIATKPLVAANRAVSSRCFSIAVPRMGEGDTGAPRSGGSVHGYVLLYLFFLFFFIRRGKDAGEESQYAIETDG